MYRQLCERVSSLESADGCLKPLIPLWRESRLLCCLVHLLWRLDGNKVDTSFIHFMFGVLATLAANPDASDEHLCPLERIFPVGTRPLLRRYLPVHSRMLGPSHVVYNSHSMFYGHGVWNKSDTQFQMAIPGLVELMRAASALGAPCPHGTYMDLRSTGVEPLVECNAVCLDRTRLPVPSGRYCEGDCEHDVRDPRPEMDE